MNVNEETNPGNPVITMHGAEFDSRSGFRRRKHLYAKRHAADAVNPVVRSKETTKGNMCITLSLNTWTKAAIRKLEAQGCTVKYRFYRSTKKSKDYKLTVTKSEPTYLNTVGKKCRYANRIWK